VVRTQARGTVVRLSLSLSGSRAVVRTQARGAVVRTQARGRLAGKEGQALPAAVRYKSEPIFVQNEFEIVMCVVLSYFAAY
jgi:hypothetical protein